MPLTKQLSIAIIDRNPALKSGTSIKKVDFPDPRVSTVTPASISFFKGTNVTVLGSYLCKSLLGYFL